MTDYGSAGLDIQTAMIRHVKAHPDPATRSEYILWKGQKVWTSYNLPVPRAGILSLALLSEAREPLQGFDVRAENGEIILAGGETVQTLRTWHDPRYEETAEYTYTSASGLLRVWNVYQRLWPDGRVTEEKWTGNAGILVTNEPENGVLFRCSHGTADPPDFTQLIFRLRVRSP